MYEEIVDQLATSGIDYVDDGGSIEIDVAALDKETLVTAVQIVNDAGADFTIDQETIVVMLGMEDDMMMEDEEFEDEGAIQDMAFDEFMG